MKKYAFGIIGGTTVKIGLFSTEETLIKKWEIPTRKDNGGSYILSDISESIAEELKNQGIEKKDVEGIGIDVPGPVLEDRIVNKCANLGWGVLDVAEETTRLTGISKSSWSMTDRPTDRPEYAMILQKNTRMFR